MKILIATGIYPPDLGGPAQYAFGLEQLWRSNGHSVHVSAFGKLERSLPFGVRHLVYLFKTAWHYMRADTVLTLDTFSVAVPIAFLSLVFGKKSLVRIGGDFLWEWYVERTGKKVLLRNFYKTEVQNFSLKEKINFSLTKFTLRRMRGLIFTTVWQKEIWSEPYAIQKMPHVFTLQNYCGERLPSLVPAKKMFIGATRKLVWKNIDTLQNVFLRNDVAAAGALLSTTTLPHKEFLSTLQTSYAGILVSLGDISPNMILDCIRCGKPFICTKECGLYETLHSVGIWVDPLNEEEIAQKILWLCDADNYNAEVQKISTCTISQTWDTIGAEILRIATII
jgi:glycosyltransferase involved in cell wall biosynthesis